MSVSDSESVGDCADGVGCLEAMKNQHGVKNQSCHKAPETMAQCMYLN